MTIAGAVLGATRAARPARLVAAALIALGGHGALWLWAHQRPARASRQFPPPALAFELGEAPAPSVPPATVPRPIEGARPDRPIARPVRSTPRLASPPPAARAGAIVAREPAGDATPLDLTGDAFVVGSAGSYAGGLTAATGTGALPGPRGAVVRPEAAAGDSAPPGRSSQVALGEQSWSCPWPAEADAAQIDEQTVVIRVLVSADGRAESAEVVTDPGHGFARAATACALRTRFAPARDASGRAVRARSPPILVRFTR